MNIAGGSTGSFGTTAAICTLVAAASGFAGLVVAGCSLANDPDPAVVANGGGSAAQGGGGSGAGPECTAATVAQDCGASSDCQAFSCDSGSCKATPAAKNTPCTDAPGDEVCDGAGECVPPSCTDGGLNGKETDVDCGGDCDPCDTGKQCSIGGDCLSGFCPGNDGVCCNSGCDSTCEACLGAKTGSAKDGECLPVTANTDPDEECTASDADCHTGECGGIAGSCKPASSATECRPKASDCDVSESCDGTTLACPSDVVVPQGQSCLAVGLCDGKGGAQTSCIIEPVEVVSGGHHTCARFATGQVKCWGSNSSGQLGLGDTLGRGANAIDMGSNLPAVSLGKGRTAKALAAGDNHTCVLLDDATVKCWGANANGQLGLGDTDPHGDKVGEMGDSLPPVSLGNLIKAVAIAAGTSHTCVLLDNATVKCWGLNGNGQLGQGHTMNRGDGQNEMGEFLQAVSLGNGLKPKAIAVGGDHTCVLLDNAAVKCWGLNLAGQLGLGNTADRGDNGGEMGDFLPAVSLGTGRTAKTIAAGDRYTCAVLDNATVKCWGFNLAGQLGLGNTNDRGDGPSEMGDNLPTVMLGTGRTAMAIDAGFFQTCALLDDATLKCWGHNGSGQLGLGDTNHRGDVGGEMGNSLLAIQLGAGIQPKAIAAGGVHTCALLDNGTVKCWGENKGGELGLGDVDNRGDGPNEMGDKLLAVKL